MSFVPRFCAAFHGLFQQGCAGPNRLPYKHGSLSLSSTSKARSARTLTPVGELLHDQEPELIISRQKLEQARGIELVRIRREQQNQDLCFSSRPFVLCGLPRSTTAKRAVVV